MRKLAKVMEVSHTAAMTATRNLGMTSYVKRKRQLLSSSTKLLRVKKGKKLVNWMRKNPGLVRVFSDEKFWTVDMARNARNDRYLATSASMVPPINATKHPQGAMMLGVVASDGKSMPPFWFPAGLKVGTNEYLDVLKTVVKPWLDSTYPEGTMFSSKIVHQGIRPSKPRSGAGNLERKACSKPPPNVASLKSAVHEEWTNMSMDYVVKVCSGFRPRVEAMIEAEGSHFEI
ncbi:Putative transposable element [Caligus rogercresseyi]|uniref:Transposable element n=1 Tax=Caligus rogercresseyi TaxID=217165 RepID=A0A7T8GZG5_CALRO|nr:Putative transposable element [Caligus rogercresseyi]